MRENCLMKTIKLFIISLALTGICSTIMGCAGLADGIHNEANRVRQANMERYGLI